MSVETRRAYNRGYYSGRRDKDRRTWRLLQIAKGWRTKAVEGFGGARCETCALWTRGGTTTKFGTCAQDYNDGVDRGCAWAETAPLSVHSERAAIVTHDNFFCANWRAP